MFRSVLSLCESRRGAALWAAMILALCFAGPVFAADKDKDKAGSHHDHGLVMCEGIYALCDAAPCTPLPEQGALPGSQPAKNPKHAVCECVVEKGKNLGPGPCVNREPVKGIDGGEYILSTYSFALPEDKYLECPAGGLRTVCFGYPCLVDKADPKHAHCTCPIKYDHKAFWTQGGKCDKAACNGLWQGGTKEDYALINKIFSEATHQTPPEMCPGSVK